MTLQFDYEYYEKIRKELLDLRNDNRLLNFNFKRASVLSIVDELPNQIYEELNNGKKFYFKEVPDASEEDLIKYGYIKYDENGQQVPLRECTAREYGKDIGLAMTRDLPEDNGKKERQDKHNDNKLQTELFKIDLDKKLRVLKSKIDSLIDEKGINTCYLVLGFLEWEEKGSKLYAPLYVVPVELKKDSTGKYYINIREDDTIDNITLYEKLRIERDIILPSINEDELPENYFERCKKHLDGNTGFAVKRYAALTYIDFSNQVIYKDLDPKNWDNELKNNKVISKIFCIKNNELDKEENNTNDDGLKKQYKTEFALIDDADSTQIESIQEALDEKTDGLVIDGPPGTGKSQTITNLIASCLNQKKKILFIAEKKAALDVVKKRLDKAGIGDFCLELHSNKIDKVNLIQDIVSSFNKQSVGKNYLRRYDELYNNGKRLRNTLDDYAELVNEQLSKIAFSLHEIFVKSIEYKNKLPKVESKVNIININNETTKDDYLDYESLVKRFIFVVKEVSKQAKNGEIKSHMWRGIKRYDLDQSQIDEICSDIRRWNNSLVNFNNYIKNDAPKIFDSDESLKEFKKISEINIASLESFKNFDLFFYIIKNSNNELKKCLESFLDAYKSKEDIEKINYLLEGNEVFTSKESLLLFREFLEKFKYFNIKNTFSFNELKEYINILESFKGDFLRLKSNLPEILSLLPESLNKNFPFSVDGLNDLEKFILLIKELGVDLCNKRCDIFKNHDCDQAFLEIKNNIEDTKPIIKKISRDYDLDKILSLEELESIKKIIDEKEKRFLHTIRNLFDEEWNSINDDIKNMSKLKRASKRRMRKIFSLVVRYKKNLTALEELNKKYYYLAVPNIQFCNFDTKIDELIKLREWYKKVEETYQDIEKNKPQLSNFLFEGKDEVLKNVVITYENKIKHDIQKLNDNVNRLANYYGDDNAILNKEILETENITFKNAEKLKDYIYKIEKILTTSISIKDFESVVQKLENFHTKKEMFESLTITKDVVPHLLNLSFDSYSNEDIQDANNIMQAVNEVKDKFTLCRFISNINRQQYIELIGDIKRIQKEYEKVKNQEEIFFKNKYIETKDWIHSDSVSDIIYKNNNALEKNMWIKTWCNYLKYKVDFENKGLIGFCDLVEDKEIDIDLLTILFEAKFFSKYSELMLLENSKIKDFYGNDHTAIIKQFVENNDELIQYFKYKIIDTLKIEDFEKFEGCGNKPSNFTDLKLIRHLAAGKRPRISIRNLLNRAGKCILETKPCFFMSPMTVSQYLINNKEIEFDYVIMDEASQIKPAKAIGAIFRGTKVIVVGDPKQLPPTSFFEVKSGNDEEKSDSILDLASAVFSRKRLKWHYRSKHESLIEFSNTFIYDNELIVFPSPSIYDKEDNLIKGIEYQKVPNGYYASGEGERVNKVEAKNVAKYVRKFMLEFPNRSIGVVAMNDKQMEEITKQIETIKSDDEEFFNICLKNEGTFEPLFVKNLENVQGDERDVIVVSLTYGKEKDTERVAQRFGPIVTEGGERRLNVLFTRAKYKMVVFSSMDSNDVIVGESNSYGKTMLHDFLKYCETSNKHVFKKDETNDFSVCIKDILEKHGYSCETNLGTSGYFIDVAVKDPRVPGSFLLAIESDGDNYYKFDNANDRDRLIPRILERNGWNVIRIWSKDLYENQEAVLNKILNKLKIIEEQNSNFKFPQIVQYDLESVELEDGEIPAINNKAPLYELTGKGTESPLEEEVKDEIEKLGFKCESQVKSHGYFIDLCVRDPNCESDFILAVECDGWRYHSSVEARDRDELREDSLKHLGWEIYRIWGPDWQQQRDVEIEKLKEKLDKQTFKNALLRYKREGLSLSDALMKFNDEFVKKVNPDSNILSKDMVNVLSSEMPNNNDDFLNVVPYALRIKILPEDSKMFKEKIFDLIMEY